MKNDLPKKLTDVVEAMLIDPTSENVRKFQAVIKMLQEDKPHAQDGMLGPKTTDQFLRCLGLCGSITAPSSTTSIE